MLFNEYVKVEMFGLKANKKRKFAIKWQRQTT